MHLNKVGNGKERRLQLQKELLLVYAWMHFAGGETSAERPGTSRMTYLAVFLCAA